MTSERQIRNRRGVTALLTVWLFGVWALLMSRAPADPDLWGHLRFGRDLLATGRVGGLDPYSFTSDRPWINHEWLSELLMAAAFDRAGAIGLNLLRVAAIAAVLALVWRRGRIVPASSRAVLVALAAVGITLRALPIRPQLFSLVCFAALLAVLTHAEDTRRDRPLVWIPTIFAVWVNLHGGWIVGLGTLALWTVACVYQRSRARWWALPAATCAAALATLMNPYGARMWTFIYSTVGLGRPMIGDWLPLYAMPPGFWLGWIVAAGLSLAAFRAPDRVPRASLVVVAVLGVAAIKVSRLDAFFCLAAVFLLPVVFVRDAPQPETVDAAPRGLRIAAALSIAVVAIVASLQLRRIDIRRDLMPEPESVDYVIRHRLTGRFLTWFDWGQFAIWHLADHGVLVSMDGRRETVYSDRVVNDHLRFYYAQDGGADYAQRIHADYAWLPLGLPAVHALESRGWSRVFQGPVSVILRPPGGATAAPFVISASAPRDFPGP